MKLKIGSGIWLLLGLLVCVVIFLLGLFLIDIPQSKKTKEVEDEIASVESSIQKEKNRLNQLKQYEQDPLQFQRQIDQIKEKIPDTVELADIIQQIDHAAEEAGLDFYSFEPSNPVSVDNFYVVNFKVVFHGRYFNMVEFFNHMERLPRTIKAVDLEAEIPDDNLPYLTITIGMRAFFMTDKGVEKIIGASGGGK
jgi:Tfp pilus assembly protein PilO